MPAVVLPARLSPSSCAKTATKGMKNIAALIKPNEVNVML
jgi:hypothetical protein